MKRKCFLPNFFYWEVVGAWLTRETVRGEVRKCAAGVLASSAHCDKLGFAGFTGFFQPCEVIGPVGIEIVPEFSQV